MKSQRRPLTTLIVSAVILDTIGIALAIIPEICHYNPFYFRNDETNIALILWRGIAPVIWEGIPLAILSCQIYLFTLWTSFDKYYAPWRWLLLLTIIFLISKALGISYYRSGSYFTTFSFGASLTIALIWILRICGLKVINSFDSVSNVQPMEIGRFQYPLRLLLEWMTALAIIMSAFCSVQEYSFTKIYFGYSDLYVKSAHIKFLALQISLTLSALWFVLGSKLKKLRQIQFIIYSVIVLGCLFGGSNGPYEFFFAISFIFQMALYLLALKLIRLAGFQLGWSKDEKGGENIEKTHIAVL